MVKTRNAAAAVLGACIVLGMALPGSARAEGEEWRPRPESPARMPRFGVVEYAGVELAPGWLNLAPDAETQPGTFKRFPLGGMATLRVARMGWGSLYWVPIQVGVGVSSKQYTFMAHLSSELGAHQQISTWAFVDVGCALGAGFLVIPYRDYCGDSFCQAGGGPIIASPVARLGLAGQHVSGGVFIRAMVPMVNTFQAIDTFGAAVVVGVDIGFPR
jgi:hypothetical protein